MVAVCGSLGACGGGGGSTPSSSGSSTSSSGSSTSSSGGSTSSGASSTSSSGSSTSSSGSSTSSGASSTSSSGSSTSSSGSGIGAPTISAQPASQAVQVGQVAQFSVTASGSSTLTYQWFKSGVAISGATASSYSTPAATAADSGSGYSVTVSVTGGSSASSTTATLAVHQTLSLAAGRLGGVGDTNGPVATATFDGPAAAVTDSLGNIYVADQKNQLIRVITTAGTVSTVAGVAGTPGANDGACGSAGFNGPTGIAIDLAGTLYIADTANDTIRKIVAPSVAGSCSVSTLAGAVGIEGSVDATGTLAQFSQPSGLTVDGSGNVFVADTRNNTIRLITPAGTVTTLAGLAGSAGSTDGTGTAARFDLPLAVAVDGAETLYVADSYNSTIRKITSTGVVTTIAGTAGAFGSADGTGPLASFDGPSSLVLDAAAANLYIADAGNNTIRKLSIASATVTTYAGTAGSEGWLDGTSAAAHFASPVGVAIDSGGNLYVADADNNMIRKIAAAGIAVTTVAGNVGGRGSADGTGGAAQFFDPHNVISDAAGNLYVADQDNNTIRKIAPGGIVTTVAGTAGVAGSADGTGTAATFNQPASMAFDSHGNLYVADSGNNTIRLISPAGAVSTFAGSAGTAGSTDGTGAAARFNLPYGLAIDATDTLYVADAGDNIVRHITTPGAVVTTLAGTAGVIGSADGTGPAAQFWQPYGIGINQTSGNIYVADRFNNTVRLITPAGVVSTIAGSPASNDFIDGTGSNAHFYWPSSIAVDPATGNLYVSDYLHNAIREIAAGGVVTTVFGAPNTVSAAVGTLPGALTGPSGIAIVGSAPTLEFAITDRLENSVLLATP